MRVRLLTTIKQRLVGANLIPLNDVAQFARVTSVGTDDGTQKEAKIWRIPIGAEVDIPDAPALELLKLGYASHLR